MPKINWCKSEQYGRRIGDGILNADSFDCSLQIHFHFGPNFQIYNKLLWQTANY